MSIPQLPFDESHIAQMVRNFYERARADELLRPVFESVVSDWDGHHHIVEDFWSRTLLDTKQLQLFRG